MMHEEIDNIVRWRSPKEVCCRRAHRFGRCYTQLCCRQSWQLACPTFSKSSYKMPHWKVWSTSIFLATCWPNVGWRLSAWEWTSPLVGTWKIINVSAVSERNGNAWIGRSHSWSQAWNVYDLVETAETCWNKMRQQSETRRSCQWLFLLTLTSCLGCLELLTQALVSVDGPTDTLKTLYLGSIDRNGK